MTQRQMIDKARKFWQPLAKANGWEIGSMSIWVDSEGNMTDHVAIRDGNSTFIIDNETDEVIAKY